MLIFLENSRVRVVTMGDNLQFPFQILTSPRQLPRHNDPSHPQGHRDRIFHPDGRE